VIDVQETLAVFSIETRRPARFEIKWGRTNSYELGYVFNDSFSREYRTSITDLEPNTKYEYQLVSYTPQGVQFILKQGTFTTTGVELISMPANANRFTAVAAEGDVRLTWKNPPIDDFALVRVVRSHLSYPAFPTDGALIYQGTNEQVVDEGVLFEYSPAYYTAFVYDTNGNVTSGAVTKVYYQGISRENDATEIPRVADESVAPENQLQLSEGMPRTDDISIIQGDITSTFVTKNITLEKSLPFIISIPRTAVSNNLKTIIVTLSDPAAAQNTYSFILKLNKKMTAYEAIILPLESTGNSKFIVEIYDYNTRVVGTYETQITFTENSALITREVFFPDAIIRFFRESFLLYLLPFLVLWLLVSYYRHNR